MDLKGGTKYFETPPIFAPHQEVAVENPLLDAFHDPLCKFNLKETSEFVKSFPMKTRRNGNDQEATISKRNNVIVEAPPTPGRPVFSFSVGSNKSFPSKWDDAQKWLISGTHESPALPPPHHHNGSKISSSQCNNVFKPSHEKSMVIGEKVSAAGFHGLLHMDHHYSADSVNNGGSLVSADVLLKDKYANEAEQVYPKFKCSDAMKEGFLFPNATTEKTRKEAVNEMIKHRDIGTEMTPLGSSTTSRCHTPFLSTSPARHNTPANRSGPLLGLSESSSTTTIDIAQFQECHLAKLQIGGVGQFDSVTSNWSSKEEEEEEISKSLRHFEINNNNNNNECSRKSVTESRESRAFAWEEEEKTKFCLRYQREEAKIKAWVNLQNAKAEAESRKLEVKIEKMRSNMEEKLMKRMGDVHRKAEEWRAIARLQHSEQVHKASEQARKLKINKQNPHLACGCFPCNTHI